MKMWTRYMLLMPVLMVQALSSCSLIDGAVYDDEAESVSASLAFTVSGSAGVSTRMADVVVQEQENGRSYRGLGQVYMVPFAISGDEITVSDHPSRLLKDASLLDTIPLTGTFGGFYRYNVYTLIRGINSFLVYGRAKEISGYSGKATYGSLQVPDLVYPDLNTLRFSPDPIYTGTAAPEAATLLAGYLTYIAGANTGENGVSWSNTSDQTLKLIYKLFTGQENDGSMVLAGAKVNVIAHVNAIYDLVNGLSYDENSEGGKLRTDILNRIKDYSVAGKLTVTTDENGKLTELGIANYPSALDLPDGAAALRWSKLPGTTSNYEFVPQTVTTTLANINNINRWCYPPELFYYANSRIDTSNEEITSYASDWDALLANYKNKNAMVTGNTKAIAIRQPLQYAVGRLKITMQGLATDHLKDDAGKSISLTNGSNPSFPLTGIIICNQHPVDFEFKPVANTDEFFIYDSQVGTNSHLRQKTTEADKGDPIPSTLVLQTEDNEDVVIALEFRNDSGTDFRGKGGVIYPGTKFYLMGKITFQAKVNPADYEKRVFTRDYLTTISTKVESLANAYNVLPNILGGRLEIGLELTPNWIQAKTSNVTLE